LAEIEGKQSPKKGLNSNAFDLLASNDHIIERYEKNAV
jgi:hypothetical protein